MSSIAFLDMAEGQSVGLGQRVTNNTVRLMIGVVPGSSTQLAKQSTVGKNGGLAKEEVTDATLTAYTPKTSDSGSCILGGLDKTKLASTTGIKRGSRISFTHSKHKDSKEVILADILKVDASSTKGAVTIGNLTDLNGSEVTLSAMLAAGDLKYYITNFVLIPGEKSLSMSEKETRGTIDEKTGDFNIVPLNRSYAQRRNWTIDFTMNQPETPPGIYNALEQHKISTKDDPIEVRIVYNDTFYGMSGAALIQPSSGTGGGEIDGIMEKGWTFNAASYMHYSKPLKA